MTREKMPIEEAIAILIHERDEDPFFTTPEYRERIHEALSMGIEALRHEIIYEKWKCIELLSELRDGYDCFEENEEPYYRALSVGIKAIREQMTKAEIKPQESEG